jgi:hypothetical protein
MLRHYSVRTTDHETGDETVDGPFPTELAAVAFAESQAEELYRSDELIWYAKEGAQAVYHVSRIAEDGTHSDPIITITVEEEAVGIEEDPTI